MLHHVEYGDPREEGGGVTAADHAHGDGFDWCTHMHSAIKLLRHWIFAVWHAMLKDQSQLCGH